MGVKTLASLEILLSYVSSFSPKDTCFLNNSIFLADLNMADTPYYFFILAIMYDTYKYDEQRPILLFTVRNFICHCEVMTTIE